MQLLRSKRAGCRCGSRKSSIIASLAKFLGALDGGPTFTLRSQRIIGMETMRGRSRGKRSLLLALVIGAGLASPLWSPPGLAAEPGGSAVSIQLPSLAPLVARVAPAVVAVAAVESAKLASGGEESAGSSSPRSVEELVRHFFDNGVGGEHVVALGSGFIIDPQGYIVTSNELATRGDKLNVTLADNTSHPARVIGRDDTTDLALIKIETHRKLPSLTWGNSDAAAVGASAMAATMI